MMMNVERKINEEQAAMWNGVGGRAWVDAQQALDQILQPYEDLLVEFVRAQSASSVLDVGCGTGSTTLAIARTLGAKDRCIGIDISEPMISVARARAQREANRATFIVGDAQTHRFEPASYDAIVSRFGVMFFDDNLQAFANLRRAATDDARALLLAWRSAAENPFMTAAERAATPLLPNIPPRCPDGPGQFAFADRQRVHGILTESGWDDIDIKPIEVPCSFPAQHLEQYLVRLGPVGRILAELDERTRNRVVEAVRAAFDPYVHGDEVRFVGACWAITARATHRRR